MPKEGLQSIVEAIIFVSDRPMTMKQLRVVFPDVSEVEISEVIENIKEVYQVGSHGIYLENVGGGWQFRTKIDKAEWVKKMIDGRPTKLTRSQLETLAIVAYRQPVTRVDIDAVRGVDSTHLLKMLLDKKLIKILGIKEAPGRPLIYGTTLEFLEFFNLKDLESLPALSDLKELKESQTSNLPLFAKDILEHSDLDHSVNPNKSSGS